MLGGDPTVESEVVRGATFTLWLGRRPRTYETQPVGACASRACVPTSPRHQGVNLLIRVDQLPSAARVPAAPGDGAQVPSLLSPVLAPKKRPPQSV